MKKKITPALTAYREVLDILAEIIALDYLKTIEKEKVVKSHG